jgi:ribonucleoside-triphosphate reductase
MGKCDGKTEVYSRVTGYMRPVSNWNAGKQAEYADRKSYNPTGPNREGDTATTEEPACERAA